MGDHRCENCRRMFYTRYVQYVGKCLRPECRLKSGAAKKEKEYWEARKKEFLNAVKRKEFLDSLDRYFEARVDFPKIRRGSRQKIETLINEEAFLVAKYLRNERSNWIPRIVGLV
jgi:hypothetical protein